LSAAEIVFGVLLVGGLVALSLYFGQQQLASLRRLRAQAGPLDEEGQYERRKARRRLVSCALTLLLGVQIAVLLVSWDSTAGRVVRERKEVDPAVEPTDEQRVLVRFWLGTAISLLVVMLAVLVLAALDVWATRRFAIGQYRKINEDRRALIQAEVNRLRSQRNGEH
jgi:hypothetical protein